MPDMPEIPAICDSCGTVFRSGVVMEAGTSATFIGNRSGPCPNCGSMGSIPDGFYDFIGETLRIVSNWSPERQRRFAEELRQARQASDPRAATATTLRGEPELQGIAERFLIPRNPGEFWALIAALLTLLALLAQFGGADEQTVIQQIIREQEPTVQGKSGADRRTSNAPPLQAYGRGALPRAPVSPNSPS